MKRLAALFFIISISQSANATFPEFEPSIICLLSGAAGYAASTDGNEALIGAAACGVGYYIGTIINDHYKEKYTSESNKQIQELRAQMDAIQMVQANKAMNQEGGGYYRVKTRVIKGQKLQNGAVRAPTLETYIDDSSSVNEIRAGQ